MNNEKLRAAAVYLIVSAFAEALPLLLRRSIPINLQTTGGNKRESARLEKNRERKQINIKISVRTEKGRKTTSVCVLNRKRKGQCIIFSGCVTLLRNP